MGLEGTITLASPRSVEEVGDDDNVEVLFTEVVESSGSVVREFEATDEGTVTMESAGAVVGGVDGLAEEAGAGAGALTTVAVIGSTRAGCVDGGAAAARANPAALKIPAISPKMIPRFSITHSKIMRIS